MDEMIKIEMRISRLVKKIFPIRTAIRIIDNRDKSKRVLSLLDNKTSFCNIDQSNVNMFLKISKIIRPRVSQHVFKVSIRARKSLIKYEYLSLFMDERYLRWFYEKYIDKNVYRVVSEEDWPRIKKHGIEPDRDPYTAYVGKIKKLYSLLLKLEKKGFGYTRVWGTQVVDAEKIVSVGIKDLDHPYVDFTASYEKVNYYRKNKGGALAGSVKGITKEIRERKPIISKNEWKLVNELYNWSLVKTSFKNKVLFFNGSSEYFETAHFQMLNSGKDYIESPFGRYEHFKKIIKKNGITVYKPYLEDKDKFYLRAVKKIPASEIINL